MKVELLAEAQFPPRSSASRRPDHGWLIHTPRPELIVVDEELVEKARFPLPSSWRAVHCVTPDLARAVVSERDQVLLIDRAGHAVWRAKHHPWGNSESESGSCWVMADLGVIWATVPAADGPDEWWVLDVESGQLRGRAPLQCYAAGSHVVAHPDGRHVGLSVGEGQDGSELYWGCWDNGQIVLSRLEDRNRVLVDVHPSGGQYLTTPHDGRTLATHEFPSGIVVATQSADAVLPVEDWFDVQAGYINERVIVAGSVEGETHVLLAAGTLKPIARVEYPERAVRQGISATGRGTWLTSDYLKGLHQLWRLAEES